MIITSRPDEEDQTIIMVTAVDLLDDAIDALENGLAEMALNRAWQSGIELGKCRILIQAAQKFLMDGVQ